MTINMHAGGWYMTRGGDLIYCISRGKDMAWRLGAGCEPTYLFRMRSEDDSDAYTCWYTKDGRLGGFGEQCEHHIRKEVRP